MLSKQHRLRHSRDFKVLGIKGRSIFGPYATARIRQTKESGPRIAFITSTKAFKLAVDRNRIKRRFRAILRELLSEVPLNMQVLFILKPEAQKATHEQLVVEVRRLLSKIPETLTKPEKMSPRALKEKLKRQARQGRRPYMGTRPTLTKEGFVRPTPVLFSDGENTSLRDPSESA